MQYIRQVQMHFTFDHNFGLIPALKVRVPPEEHTTLVSTTQKAWKAFKYLVYFSEMVLATQPRLLNLRDPAPCVLNDSKFSTLWHLGEEVTVSYSHSPRTMLRL